MQATNIHDLPNIEARRAYAKQIEICRGALAEISRSLDDTTVDPFDARHIIHYGHVGDIEHIAKQLMAIVHSFDGE